MILAVCSLQKGNAAEIDNENSTGCARGVVEVWQLDMANYGSVQNVIARAKKELERVNAFIADAGIGTPKFPKRERRSTLFPSF